MKRNLIVFYEPQTGPLRFLIDCEGVWNLNYVFTDIMLSVPTRAVTYMFSGIITKVHFSPKIFESGSKFYFVDTEDKFNRKEQIYRFRPARKNPNLQIDEFVSFQYESCVFL